MTKLAVNIDHIATLREARGGTQPEPLTGALLSELAGASGIVCHLREDRRHINERDVRLLRETITTKLDLEMSATEEIISIALEILPELVTFVPEKREELTTEGGLNVVDNVHYYTNATGIMHDNDIQVSFFIEPSKEQIEFSLRVLEGSKSNIKGAFSIDGKMIDKPIIERAEKIISRAKRFGLL